MLVRCVARGAARGPLSRGLLPRLKAAHICTQLTSTIVKVLALTALRQAYRLGWAWAWAQAPAKGQQD